MNQNGGRQGMKWFVTIVASVLTIFSTVFRTINGGEADKYVCAVFVVSLGFVWGANMISYIIKK